MMSRVIFQAGVDYESVAYSFMYEYTRVEHSFQFDVVRTRPMCVEVCRRSRVM